MEPKEKISEIEKALVKLTTIQGIQTDQMGTLLKSNENISVLLHTVEENSKNINSLFKLNRDLENTTHKEITNARTSLIKSSYAKLFLCLSIATGLSWKLFDINSVAIHEILETKTKVLHRVLTSEKDIKYLREVHND